MIARCLLLMGPLCGLLLTCPAVAQAQERTKPGPMRTWKKTVVDTKFRSEGVAVADVNKDGKNDILVGDLWYEAPDWKPHDIRKHGDHGNGANGYSQCFACWADDINADGWPDLIVVGFPGAPCHWYENPQGKDGLWKEHFICKSACNETPQYLDLFRKGKRVLLMGYENKRMIWLQPGKDPAAAWEIHPVSDPSRDAPGTHMFAHGLGAGDLNADGRDDVMCTDGWWEQPAKVGDEPWQWHAADLGPACSDMYAADIAGSGKADVLSSAAHDYGLWLHLARPGKEGLAFVREALFPTPRELAHEPKGYELNPAEKQLYNTLNKLREEELKAPFAADMELCRMARDHASRFAATDAKEVNISGDYKGGKIVVVVPVRGASDAGQIARKLLEEAEKAGLRPGCEIGVGYGVTESKQYAYTLIVGDRGRFSVPSQTHALHYVDINGDGVKDLVTGRRWWAHGPKGDPGSGDSAYLYWFEAKRDRKGATTFTPHVIDEDSGVGTQFAIIDFNGDGLLDIVISNKRGVCFILQSREQEPGQTPPPARRD